MLWFHLMRIIDTIYYLQITVPFQSIRRSHIMALPKSTKCHACPRSHRVPDENCWGNMSHCWKKNWFLSSYRVLWIQNFCWICKAKVRVRTPALALAALVDGVKSPAVPSRNPIILYYGIFYLLLRLYYYPYTFPIFYCSRREPFLFVQLIVV